MADNSLSVVIADDHAIVRHGLRELVIADGRFHIVQEVENGMEAIAAAKVHTPDVMLLDINMPYVSGVEVLSEILRWSKLTRIIIYSGIHSAQIYSDLLVAGVCGIALKSDPESELQKCLSAAVLDETYCSASIEALVKQSESNFVLSAREHQVLQHIARGLSNTQIADNLSISPKTVDNHRSNLMRKMEAHSAAQLIRKAVELELIDAAEI